MGMSKLEIKNIEKKFGKKEVLKNVSFNLESGHIYGLLGRNGVGKVRYYRSLIIMFYQMAVILLLMVNQF